MRGLICTSGLLDILTDLLCSTHRFGAMIVDALREYSNPVFIYLPPHSELRGGSWVVVDPTINEEKMSMFADPLSRGGILEPAGIIEVKFRKPDILQVMRRTDDELKTLEAEIDACAFDSDIPKLKEQIKNREDLLYPVYTQVAMEFADAHDKTGRMKAKGVIRDAVEWARSREYFYYAAKRRILQDSFVTKMKTADPSLDTKTSLGILKSMCPTDWEDDKSTIEFFTGKTSELDDKLKSIKKSAMLRTIESLTAELDALK
jgi:acetyl-CoA carboxylase/biotin carboxylase 1